MTSQEFKYQWDQELLQKKDKELRDGQWLMICLANVWTKEYHRIIHSIGYLKSEIDCFYIDERMQITWEHLEKVWHNYPN